MKGRERWSGKERAEPMTVRRREYALTERQAAQSPEVDAPDKEGLYVRFSSLSRLSQDTFLAIPLPVWRSADGNFPKASKR